jgi:uncharacterized protein
MAAIQALRLTNANIYNEGNSLAGRAEEMTLPAIKAKTSEHKALGMVMPINLPSGFEAMNGKIKWNAIYPDNIKDFGSPFTTKKLQVRANLETYDSSGRTAQTPLVAYVTVRFKDALPAISLKQNDNAEQESEFECSYYRLEVGGEKLIEMDAFAQIFFVNGTDELAEYRAALGL